MYIRRKVYSISALQDELIEKAFSEGYKKGKEDSEKEDKERVTTDITKTKSYRGVGRSYGFGGISGVVGRAAGVKHATKLSKEGKVTDKEMIKKAGRRAALVGGLGSLVEQAASYKSDKSSLDMLGEYLKDTNKRELSHNDKKLILLGKGLGQLGSQALAARAGARKNVKERLLKKHLEDNDIKTDKKKTEE